MAPQLPRNVLDDLDTDEDELDDQNDDLDSGIRPEIDGDVSNDEDGYHQHCGDECPDHDIMNNVGDFNINNNANKKVETSRTKLNDTDLTPQPTRRLIKADLSLLNLNSFDQDDDDDMYPYPSPDDYKSFPLCGSSNVPASGQDLGQKSPWQKAAALDLAKHTEGLNVLRRHSITLCEAPVLDNDRVIYGTQSFALTSKMSRVRDPALCSSVSSLRQRRRLAKSTYECMSQDELKHMQWKNCTECLSLTLEEVVHIRSVLTKAELESLLVDTRQYEDVAKGKVCFLCRKTKFSFFGPWGQKCKLCKRNVCEKCCSKMRIPTEHFASIPVYMLSPSPMSSSDDESSPRSAWRMSDFTGMLAKSTGSAPSSPMTPSKADHSISVEPSIKMPPTSLPTIPCSPDECPASLAPDAGTPVLSSTSSDVKTSRQESLKEPVWQSKPRLLRSQTLQRADHSGRQDKLYGTLMNVCKECKAMVCHIIVASRTSMMLKQKSERVAATFPLRLKTSKESSPPSRDLNLNLSPIY